MNKNSEIIVVEDDQDDIEFISDIFQSLNISNKVVFFEDPTKVIPYLREHQVQPFMIFSDINMPKLDGFELRELMINDIRLKRKSVPFIFLSTSDSPDSVNRAYELGAHGYFKKVSGFKEFKAVIENILVYWNTSRRLQLQ